MSPTGNETLRGDAQVLPPIPWVEALYRNSPLKREKFFQIARLLPQDLTGMKLLDIGGDNGVMSYKLRELGGQWSSADLIQEAVISIRKVVTERVYQLEGMRVPVSDSQFDIVAIVDMLEHLPDDRGFIEEMYRIVKPDGVLLVNVPNPKEGLLRRLRFAIGQTDEKHGHLRPGYTLSELEKLLDPYFYITTHRNYSRLFAQLVDTLVNGGLALLKTGKKGKKGTLVTADTVTGSKNRSLLIRLLGPVLSCLIRVDKLFPCTHGSMLIVRAVRQEGHNE